MENRWLLNKIILLIFLLQPISKPQAGPNDSFDNWKQSFIQRASKAGLPKDFLNSQLSNVVFLAEVIEKDKNQITENKEIDYELWIKKWLRENPSRIELAKAMLIKHKTLLEKIERQYQVDKEIIISLWGVETLFGQITGDYDLLNSLASLSFEGRRRSFFETQLIASLKLIHNGHVTRTKLKGSWAGATGQCQFMPSNIIHYAQDFDGNGIKDIWTNESDIFASIANLLQKSGWKKGLEVGQLVKTTRAAKLKINRYRTVSEYNKLGFRKLNGTMLTGKWKRMLSEIPLQNSPLILRGTNYQPIMRWNRSSLFAAFCILMTDGLKNK